MANWSYVERIPAGGGAGQSGSASYAVDVFKCAGTGTDANDAATDWYFALEIPATDGAVTTNFKVFEDYDGTAKQFRRPVAGSTSTAPVSPGTPGYWRSNTLAAYASVTGALTFTGLPTLNTTGFSYWIKLHNDGVHFATRVGASSASWGASLMDTLISGFTDSCPLMGYSDGGAGFSNLPGITDATLAKWRIENMTAWTLQEGSNATNENDIWQGAKGVAARLLCNHETSNTDMRLVGGMRGLIKSDLLGIRSGGTVELGDTTTIDGNTWTVIAKGSLGGLYSGHVITRPV